MDKKTNVRIVDIARMAKVSVGTVDRVIHNRGRVSEEKRILVEQVLKEINYEPNMVARFLASRRSFMFAVIVPFHSNGEYWELVCSGIDKAVHDLKDFNVSVEYLFFDQHDEKSFAKTVNKLDNTDYSGILIATLFKKQVISLSEKLDTEEIPYIYIDSNIPAQNNISYFGADSNMSGAIAAKLMLSKIGKEGSIVIGQAEHSNRESSTQIENRETGFLDYLKENGFKGKISYLDFKLGAKSEGVQNLNSILDTMNGNIGGIVFNSRIYELDMLREASKHKDMILIGYDPIDKNVEALKEDKVAFLISQRSMHQGYDGIKALSNYLIFNTVLDKDNYMPIDILMKENIDFYNNYKF